MQDNHAQLDLMQVFPAKKPSWMPRWFRILLSGWSFLLFFSGSPFIGVLIFPVLRLFARTKEEQKDLNMRFLYRCYRIFSGWCKLAGLIEYPTLSLPADFDPKAYTSSINENGGAYVLVANHPSLIDMILMMGRFEGLTCVAKGSWYDTKVLGPLLRATAYLRGPQVQNKNEESDRVDPLMLPRMIEHLKAGHPLLVFPEGTRSKADRLNRFRRGAFEAAIAAEVPILPVFIAVDRPMLPKGDTWYNVPKRAARYAFEWLPPIDTRVHKDSKRIAKEIQDQMASRYQALIEHRKYLEAQLSAKTVES